MTTENNELIALLKGREKSTSVFKDEESESDYPAKRKRVSSYRGYNVSLLESHLPWMLKTLLVVALIMSVVFLFSSLSIASKFGQSSGAVYFFAFATWILSVISSFVVYILVKYFVRNCQVNIRNYEDKLDR